MKNEVTIGGEVYRRINGNWVDEHYMIPSRAILAEIVQVSIDGEALVDLPDEDLETCLRDCKQYTLYQEAMNLALLLWERYATRQAMGDLRRLLPIQTSLLRSLGKSKEAINFYLNATRRFGRGIESIASLTSLAAAYCDVDDYEFAKKLCDRAYAWQGGSQGTWNELTLVYKRIEKNWNP